MSEKVFVMSSGKKITTYDIAAVGIMAAFVYVGIFFRINIPMPIGKAMLHFGNVFCLLAGLLLGPMRGGLAAGFGSFIFDMTSDYASSAPFTLVFKFVMAWVAGSIAYGGKRGANDHKMNIVGAICGSVSYVILYVGKNFIEGYYFLRNPIETCITDAVTKGSVSLINGAVAVIVSYALFPIFRSAMRRAGIYRKLFPTEEVMPQAGD